MLVEHNYRGHRIEVEAERVNGAPPHSGIAREDHGQPDAQLWCIARDDDEAFVDFCHKASGPTYSIT
jgi:hypothetical protein